MQKKQPGLELTSESAPRIPYVECLGLTFETDDARRTHFSAQLSAKLEDPAFRKQDGFPQGADEDILRMSDPPYYTACPNPFLEDFVRCYGRPYDPAEPYQREPFAADVSEGKGDPLYSAHSYHTKVPPRAIAKYILHYTQPHDVVLDAFCGSGMTGVAAGLCSDPILAAEGRAQAGPRAVILCDLSPAATFISSVYLRPPDAISFDAQARGLLDFDHEVNRVWTLAVDSELLPVEYYVWAEVFVCPHCQGEVVSEAVVSAAEDIGTAKEFQCAHCRGLVSKAPSKNTAASKLERRLVSVFDFGLQREIKTVRRRPIFAVVERNGSRERIDLSSGHASSAHTPTAEWYPTAPLIQGERFLIKDYCHAYGVTHIHHFYLPRQLYTYATLWKQATSVVDASTRRALMFFLQSNALGMTILNRYGPTHYSQVSRYFSGTLYVPSATAETSPSYTYRNKLQRLTKAFALLKASAPSRSAITTQSATTLAGVPDDSVDYIFVDPPFGRNLQYSELNQVWEAWLRVNTDRQPEAVIDDTRQRDVTGYGQLMRAAFRELYRVLKPARWVTIEFHNQSNTVWFALQESLSSAGFVVADVKTLNKQHDTYKQSRQGLIKQDLVISAYKPSARFLERIELVIGTQQGAWEFVSQHLSQVPVLLERGEVLQSVSERDPYRLFDRMVAYHVQRGVTVPLTAAEFFVGLIDRFAERDGMYFLSGQVAIYDRRRSLTSSIEQLDLFVDDEATAIRWLRAQLALRPMTLQQLHPDFTKRLQSWNKHEAPLELLEILAQNFICYDGGGPVPPQIHAYLSTNYKDLRSLSKSDSALVRRAKGRWYVPDPAQAIDIEKLRQAALLREFQEYVQNPPPRMRVFRTEAIRAGFKAAYDARDYDLIVRVAEKLPESVLREDEQLLMYHDVASTRLGR